MKIEQWLKDIGFEKYISLFSENEIAYSDLAEINNSEDLLELGIENEVDRNRVLTEISKIIGKDATISSKSNYKKDELEIIQKYPYLIAFPFYEMLEEENYFLKIQLMKDVLLNILKYLGLLTATEYLQSEKKSKTVSGLFREKLYQPQFGHWNHFIRECLIFLTEENHNFEIPELPEAYKKIELDDDKILYNLEVNYWDDFGELHIEQRSVSAISGLISFRNKYIGHSVTLTKQKSKEVFSQYYPILIDLLKQLRFCVKYPMLKYNDGKTWKLMSNEISALDDMILSNNKNSNLWLQLPKNKQLHLVPFFILPKQYISGTLDSVEMFIYQQYTGKRIIYFSPDRETGETSGDVVEQLNKLLLNKEKEPEIELSDLSEMRFIEIMQEETDRVRNQLIKERKIIPGIYQSRVEAEDSIHRFIASRKAFYFLASEAGSGKTNLLNAIGSDLEKEKRKVIFMRASRFQTSKLQDEILLLLNLKKDSDLSKHPVLNPINNDEIIILLDGGNEHQQPLVLLDSCFELLKSVPAGSIKIILSWRIYSRKDLPKIDEVNEQYLYEAGEDSNIPKRDESLLVKYAANLKSLDKRELASAWNFYTSHESKKFKPQFTLADLEIKDRAFIDQLTNPLHLRIFLELNSNRGLKKAGKLLRIWPNWYAKLEKDVENFQEFIMELIQVIYNTKDTVIELDYLFDNDLIGSYIRDLNVDSPYQKLLMRGVLTQYFYDNLPVVTFSIEAAWHYVLSVFVNKLPNIQTGEQIVVELSKNKEIKGFKEAVGLMLREDVISGNFDRLLEIFAFAEKRESLETINLLGISVMKKEDYLRVTIPALLYAIEYENTNEVMNTLLQNSPQYLIIALLDVNEQLAAKLKLNKQYELLTSLYKSEYYNQLQSTFKLEILNNLGACCNNMENQNEALKYFGKALELIEPEMQKSDVDRDYLIKTRFLLLHNTSIALAQIAEYDNAIKSAELLIRDAIAEYGENSFEIIKYYETLGGIYLEAHKVKDAETKFLIVVKMREKLQGADHPDNAMTYYNLGSSYMLSGKHKKAKDCLTKAIIIFESKFGYNHPKIAYAYSSLGSVMKNLHDYASAEKYSKQAIKILEKIHNPEFSAISPPLNCLGIICVEQKRYEKAVEFLQRSVLITEKSGEGNNPKIGAIYKNLGIAYYNLNNYEKAKEYLQKAITIISNIQEKNNSNIMDVTHLLGNADYGLNNYDEAIKSHLISLELNLKFSGSTGPKTATVYYQLGLDYYYNKQYNEAIPMLQRALEINEKLYGKNSEDVMTFIKFIGNSYYKLSIYQEAEKHLTILCDYYRKKNDTSNITYQIALKNLANTLYYDGRKEKSKPLYEELLNIYKGTDTNYSSTLNQLCMIHYYASEYEQAKQYQLQLIELALKFYDKYSPNIGHSYNMLGLIYMNSSNYDEAEKALLESIEIREKVYSEPDAETAVSCENLAINYKRKKELIKSIEYYLKAVEIRKIASEKNNPTLADDYAELAYLFVNSSKYEEGYINGMKAYNMRKIIFGENHLKTANSALNTSSALLALSRLEEAEKYGINAKNGYEAINHNNMKLAYTNLGKIYRALGNVEKAEEYEQMR